MLGSRSNVLTLSAPQAYDSQECNVLNAGQQNVNNDKDQVRTSCNHLPAMRTNTRKRKGVFVVPLLSNSLHGMRCFVYGDGRAPEERTEIQVSTTNPESLNIFAIGFWKGAPTKVRPRQGRASSKAKTKDMVLAGSSRQPS